MGCIVLNDPARDPRRALAARSVVPKTFEWYRRDFDAAAGLRSFLLRDLDAGPARDTLVAGASPCRARRQDDSAHRPEPAE